jgi:hypothetical protein
MRVRLGTIALTSLMTLDLAPASNDSSFTLKIVFSFGFAATSSSTPTSSAAPAPAAGSAAPAVGKAISWMFRRVCMVCRVYMLERRKEKGLWDCLFLGGRGRGTLTLRSVTRSAAWRSVRDDMSSTSLCSAGSEGDGVGVGVEVGEIGGGGDDDGVVASAVAVASARTRMRIHAKGLLRAETLCRCVASVINVEGKRT